MSCLRLCVKPVCADVNLSGISHPRYGREQTRSHTVVSNIDTFASFSRTRLPAGFFPPMPFLRVLGAVILQR